MSEDERKHLLGLVVNNLDNAATSAINAVSKLRELGEVEHTGMLEDFAIAASKQRNNYRAMLKEAEQPLAQTHEEA